MADLDLTDDKKDNRNIEIDERSAVPDNHPLDPTLSSDMIYSAYQHAKNQFSDGGPSLNNLMSSYLLQGNPTSKRRQAVASLTSNQDAFEASAKHVRDKYPNANVINSGNVLNVAGQNWEEEWQNTKEKINKVVTDPLGSALEAAKYVSQHPEQFVGPSELKVGLFSGVKSAGAESLQRLTQAKHLTYNTTSALDPGKVFRNTGWFRDPVDKNWKELIPNFDAGESGLGNFVGEGHTDSPGFIRFNATGTDEISPGDQVRILSEKRGTRGTPDDPTIHLPDVFNHTELYKRYPDARNIVVKPIASSSDTVGRMQYNGPLRQWEMHLAAQPAKDMLDTIHHELQHFIQYKEEFPYGVSSRDFNGWYNYARQSGEVEARNASLWRTVSGWNKQYLAPSDTLGKERDASGQMYTEVPMSDIQKSTTLQSRMRAAGVPVPSIKKDYKPYTPRKIDQAGVNDLNDETLAPHWIKYMQEHLEKGKSVRDIAKNLQTPETEIQRFVNTYSKQIAEPEKVGEAAIRTNSGDIHTGQMHFDALEKALSSGVPLKDAYEAEQGYVTNRGNFLTREQAANFKPAKKSTITTADSFNGISHPGYRHYIIDNTTGKQVGGEYINKSRARRRVDALDNEYGSYNHHIETREVTNMSDEERRLMDNNNLTQTESSKPPGDNVTPMRKAANDNKKVEMMDSGEPDFSQGPFEFNITKGKKTKENTFTGADRNKYPLTYETKDEDVRSTLKDINEILKEQKEKSHLEGYHPGLFEVEFQHMINRKTELEQRIKDTK
jgi:hypothetical protein